MADVSVSPASLPDFIKSTESGRRCLARVHGLCLESMQAATTGKEADNTHRRSEIHKLVNELCQPYCKAVLLVSLASPVACCHGDQPPQTLPDAQLVVVVAARDADVFDTTLKPNALFRTTYVEPWMQVFELGHYLEECMRCNLRLVETLLAFDKVDAHRDAVLSTLRSQVAWDDFASKDFFNRSLGQLESLLSGRAKDGKKDASAETGEVTLAPGTTEHRLLMYSMCILDKKLTSEQLTAKSQVPLSITNVKEHLKQLRTDSQKVEGLERHISSHLRESCLTCLEVMRLDGLQLPEIEEAGSEDVERAQSLLTQHGGNIAAVDPSHLLLMTITGSKLYRLNVASSDDDFLGIYAISRKQYVRDYNQVQRKTVLDNRGKKLDSGDIALYEASKFVEALLHGGVEVIQMLFTNDLLYESKHFQFLKTHRMKLLSEKVITNYCGYVDKHFDFLKKPQKTPSKVLYHIYHKLGELERLCRGEGPKVQVDGEERDFILRIRTGPMEGEFGYEALLQRAHERFDEIKAALKARTVRLPELGDVQVLREWLLSIYGIPKEVLLQKPLIDTTAEL
eukprot:scpid38775/ scgid5899/ 